MDVGLADSDADIEFAAAAATGLYYSLVLAGTPPPADWPERSAALLWRAIGATPPRL